MNRLIRFSDGQKSYSVPEEEVEAFQEALPTARRMTRFIDRAGKTYSVPDDEVDAFRDALPEAELLNSLQLANGARTLVPQSKMSKFLRSREYREGDAAAREAMREQIDAEIPEVDAQGVVSAAAEGAAKGALRSVGKIGGAAAGLVTGPMRAVGSLFGRDNALVKGADWVDDSLDWFAEDLGVGGTSGDAVQDVLSGIGEIGSSALINVMPWLVGGGAASKIGAKALFAANVLGAGGRSATETYDKVKAEGGSEEDAYMASLQAQAVSTAAAFVFGKLSVENYLEGLGAKGVARLIEGEVKTAGKGFNGIVKAVANGYMRRGIAQALVGGAEEGVTEGAESFLLSVIQQHAGKDDVDFEEAALTALKDAGVGAGMGLFLGGLRAAEGSKGWRGLYEKQARAEVTQLMADMAPNELREMNPKKFDEIAKKFARGEGVSRKDANELGLPPSWSKEQRNEVFDEYHHEKAAQRQKRAKMDEVQEAALREDIAGFVGDGPEAQRVYDRVVQGLKDATVLDDPTAREKLIGAAAEAEEAAVRAENDAQERYNADILAREEKRYDEFMLAHEEARANGVPPAEGAAKPKEVANEARTDEAQQKFEQAQRIVPPEAEAARPVETTETSGKADGAVSAAVKPSTSAAKGAGATTPPTANAAVWTDKGGSQHEVEGYSQVDAANVRKGDDVVVSHSNGIPYKGEVVSIGPKNVKIRTNGGMGGEAVLTFPRSEIVGRKNNVAEMPLKTETAAKKSFEERYREWAKEDAPAWAKDLSPEEKAEYERLLDEVLRPKEGKDDIERSKQTADAYRALEQFEKAHTPKRGRGRPKKEDVGARTDTPEALADNYAKFVQQRIDRFNSAKTSADFDKVKDFADGELEAREKVKSNPEAIKKCNEKYGKLFAEQNRVIHEATEKGRQAQEAETAKAEEDAKAFRASPEGFNQLEKDVNRIFGRYRLNVNSVHKPEEVVSVSDLIKRGYKVEKAKRGAAYNYRLTPPDGNGWFKIGKKELRLDGEEYNRAIADLIEYSERVANGEKVVETSAEPTAAKVETAETKPSKPDMKPVIAAMHKIGDLAMRDISTIEKALAQAEGHGQTERANNIRTFLEYKKSVGVNAAPKSDKSEGGRYRASIESDKPLDDPKFQAWAKKRGVAPTQAKREEYDAAMVKSATKKLSRWIKGVKVKSVNAISEADLKGDTRAQKIIDAEKHSRAALEEISSGKEFGVLTNEKFGEIKYPLGKTGKGGLGFLHIVEHRMNEGASLQDAIETAYRVGVAAEIGEESRTIYNTHHLDYDGVRAIIAVMPDGSKVITGYKIDADEAAAAIRRATTNKSRSHVSSNEVIGELQKILARRANDVNGSDSNFRPLRDGKRIVGSYNIKTGEVTLAKGASVETVAHELGWHASFDWAKRNAKTNNKAKALYERMLRFAEDAPPEIKAEVAALYGKLDADAFADEVGAMLFTRGKGEEFANAINPDIDAPWYKKAWNAVVDIVKDWLSAHGMNRVDLDGVENMNEARFKDFLATAMLSGKTLGERKGFSMELDNSKKAKWERKLSDRFAPIRDLIERVDGADGEAYRMARTLEGMAQMGRNRAERTMKRVDKILGKDISPEFLAQYMQAKAYEERNAKIEKRNQKKDGSGMTAEDAAAILAEADERGIVEKCDEAANILWKMQDEGLQRRVDAGLISQETADEWRKAEPHHVPWRDVIDPDSGEWMGRNFAGKEFETAEGRSTFASGDPITLMLQEYENAYARAAENALRQHLSDIARLNGDVGTIYDGITVDAKGKRSFIKYTKGEQSKLLSIPDGAKIESTKKDDGGMVNVLAFRENGDTKYLVLNGSLGEAVAAAVTGRSLSRPPAWLSGIMRGYAATATALSPTFAIRNTMADHFDIHGNMVKDFGIWKGEKLFAKMVAEEAKMSKELLKYVHTGTFEVDANGKATTAFGKLIEEYEAAGGSIGGMRTEGYDVIQKRIQKDFSFGRNKLRSIGKEVAAGWTDLQKMSELSTRLATFKVMKESGMSAKEAAMWSRESTVDFNKKGNLTNITNILWMFSNSALGSGVRQAKGLLTTKNGLQLAGGLAAWGFIEGMLECAMNAEDDDEADKEGTGSGADLNEYTRQNSAYLRFGNKVYRTNLHMGPYGIIKYAGNVAARVMCGRLTAEKAAKELGLTAVEVAAAFTGAGNVSADAILETGVPTALQPFVQMTTGKDYAGRPLYKKKYNEAKPDSSHGRKSTAEGYKKIAEGINALSGGDKYSKGWVDIAPETVKLITETAGKNFARDIVNIAQTAGMAISGDWDARNTPFARDVVRKVDGNENRYYEALRRYDEDKEKLKDPDLVGEARREFFRTHPWLRSNGKKGSTVVSTLETKIKELAKIEENENLSEERREAAKARRRKLQARVIERMSAQ